jgi:hypothetical protein
MRLDAMAEEAPDTKPEPAPEGVFGNLPGTRPGTRSPRRDAAGRRPPAKAAQAETHTSPPPPAPPSSEPPPPVERDAPVAAEPGGGQPRITSVEDLAWAGIAVAAQAATVGVRFASRALEAARKSADRD